eukprot:1160977-Pelagomonas_calceolata.AAC.1
METVGGAGTPKGHEPHLEFHHKNSNHTKEHSEYPKPLSPPSACAKGTGHFVAVLFTPRKCLKEHKCLFLRLAFGLTAFP